MSSLRGFRFNNSNKAITVCFSENTKTIHLYHCRIIPLNQDSINQVLIRETNRIVGLPMSDLVFLLMILSPEQRGQQVVVETISMEVNQLEV